MLKQKNDKAVRILILNVRLDTDHYILINSYSANTETEQLTILMELQSFLKSFDIIQNYPINTVIPEHVTRIIYLHYGDGTVLDFKEEEKEVRLNGITFKHFYRNSFSLAFFGSSHQRCL